MSTRRLLQYLLFLAYCFSISAEHLCSNDEDLRYHQCQCNEIDRSIRCSSLPHRCRTCMHYQTIYFDQSIEILPEEIFGEYQLSNSFRIHFVEVKNLSVRAFSKIHLQPNQILDIIIIKYSSSMFPTHAFEQLLLSSNSKFHLEIHQITNKMFTIEKHAFAGIEFHHRSYFQFSIRHAIDTIAFQINSGSMILSSYARMELNFSHFNRLIGFERCFHGIKQEESSELRIRFNRFSSASFSHGIFSNIHQFSRSLFHLSFSDFDSLILERTFLEHVIQSNSSIIISVINQTNNLCLTNETLKNITQENHSIFRLEIHFGQNLLFPSEAIRSLTVKSQSKFIIDIIHCYDTYFSRNSLVNFSLIDQSLMEIGIQSGQNLIFETNAIEQVEIFSLSKLKIAFQYSYGAFQMAMNAFSRINQGKI